MLLPLPLARSRSTPNLKVYFSFAQAFGSGPQIGRYREVGLLHEWVILSTHPRLAGQGTCH
jgi:hypothetical protein